MRESTKVPTMSPRRGEVVELNSGMDFGPAFRLLIDGKKIRRLEWEDHRVYVAMKDNKVMIFLPSDQMLHPLIISDGDILGEDWVVVREDWIGVSKIAIPKEVIADVDAKEERGDVRGMAEPPQTLPAGN